MVEFVYPQFFWIMIIPFIIFAILIVTNRETVSRVFGEKALSRLKADGDAMPKSVRNTILLTSVFFMIVALSRPVIDQGKKRVQLEGLTLVMALDISGSMRSKDIYPNRLEFAKQKMKQLLDFMPSDEIALSAFAHSAFVLSPFTDDTAALKQIVSGVDENYISMASTDFESIANQAIDILRGKDEKILVLFSDGGDEKQLKDIASILKREGITLYAVLIGTKKGAPVLDDSGKPLVRRDGTIVITQLNEKLGKVALETGGSYLIAGNGNSDMRELARKIHDRFSSAQRGTVEIRDRKELFIYPLLLSALLLLGGLSSLPVRRKKIPSPGDAS